MIPPDQYRYGSLKDWKLRARDEANPRSRFVRTALVWIICWIALLFLTAPIAEIVIGIVATLKGTF